MRRRLWGAAAAVVLMATGAQAQTAYPIAATVVWDPPPVLTDPTQVITSYIVTYNGVATTVTPASACTSTECDFKISIPDGNSHAVSVVAVNMWGQSAPAGFTFAAVSPGKSNNVKVRVP